MDSGRLDEVEADVIGPNASSDRMHTMLDRWRKSTIDASWLNVVLALEKIELVTLAEECVKVCCGEVTKEGNQRRAKGTYEHQDAFTKS